MPMNMTPSEYRAYTQICEYNGKIMTVACDQRGGMRKAITPDPGEQAKISNTDLGNVKGFVVSYLANHCASVLLDPTCAVPQVVENGTLSRDTGLLIGLDDSGWEIDENGYRLSKLVPSISARKVRELGGTAGKLMVYLRPDIPEANDRNLRIITDCIIDFAREDVLLVVEILTYQVDGESDTEYHKKYGDLIVGSAELALARGAKVLKMPYPGSAEACQRLTEVCNGVPWAVLSAGVDHETFLGQVETAMACGASGVIAGRALWKDSVALDASVARETLENKALPRLQEIQNLLDK